MQMPERREPSPPRSSAGERVPKADEGAFQAYLSSVRAEFRKHADATTSRLGLSRKIYACGLQAPLIRLRHLLPPQEARGRIDVVLRLTVRVVLFRHHIEWIVHVVNVVIVGSEIPVAVVRVRMFRTRLEAIGGRVRGGR